jgi:hypothetical protein
MASISKLSVVLSASIGSFSAGMKQAGQQLDSFTSQFKASVGMMAGIGASLGAVAGIGGIGAMIKGQFEAIASTDRLAQSLGVSTQALSRLQYAASVSGVSTEAVGGALFKMEKALGGVDEFGMKAADAFKQLGLDSSKLIDMKPDEAFGVIGDALNKVDNANDRNALSMKIFGKSVAEVLPLLRKGSDGLNELGDEGDKLHATFNEIDAIKIEQANEAMEKMHKVLEGAINTLAIKMAPFIEALSKKLVDLATQGEGLAGVISHGFEKVVGGVAAAMDYLELFKAGWYLLKAAGLEAFSYLEAGIGKLLSAMEYLAEKLGKSHQGWGDSFKAESQKLEASAVEAFDKAGESYSKFASGENSAKAEKFLHGIETNANKAAQAMADARPKMNGLGVGADENAKAIEKVTAKLEEMQKAVDQFNMSKAEKAADDIKRIGGDSSAQLMAEGLQLQLDKMEEAKKAQEDMAKDAQKLWDETKTPLEAYTDEVDKLNKLMDAGVIDAERYNRGIKLADSKLEKSNKREDKAPPSLLTAGSQEAASFVAKIQAQEKGRGPQDQLLQKQEQGNKYLERITNAVEKSGTSSGLLVASFN